MGEPPDCSFSQQGCRANVQDVRPAGAGLPPWTDGAPQGRRQASPDAEVPAVGKRPPSVQEFLMNSRCVPPSSEQMLPEEGVASP